MADELDRVLNDLRDELKDLTRVLQSTFKIFDRSSKSEAEGQKQVNEQRRKFLDVLRKEGKITEEMYKSEIKNTTATTKNTGALGKATKATKKFSESVASAGKNLLGNLAEAVLETGKNFAFADRRITGFADATKGFDNLEIPGLKLSLSDFGKAADFNVGIFKTLSQTGAGFGKSVINLRNAATSANMPILDFVDLIQQNSTSFAGLFGSVMDGMPAIQGFTRALRFRTQDELAEFGLNLEETSEFLATQLEIQRATGQSDSIRQKDLVTQTVEYAKNLTKLSKLTGVSVKELDEQNKQSAINGTFQASLFNLTTENADIVRAQNAALEKSNPEFAQVFKNIVQFGVATSDQGKVLEVLTNGAISDAVNRLKEGSIGMDEFANLTGRAFNRINTAGAKAIADAGVMGQAGAAEALNILAVGARATSQTVDQQQKAQGDNTKTLVGFKDTIDVLKVQAEEFSTKVLGEILNSPQLGKALDMITGGVRTLTEGDSLFDRAFDTTKNAIRVTSAFFGNLGTDKGTGKGTILSTADDSIFGMARRGGERLGTGGQGNSIYDILTPYDTLNEKLAKSKIGPNPMFNGSDGFKDFGSGTPATLHGIEAVVPKNDMGQLAKVIQQMTGNSGPDTPAVSNVSATTSENYLRELVELNKNAQRALNTLVTVSAMTEKNTKNTNNNVANMGGSLV